MGPFSDPQHTHIRAFHTEVAPRGVHYMGLTSRLLFGLCVVIVLNMMIFVKYHEEKFGKMLLGMALRRPINTKLWEHLALSNTQPFL